MGHHRALKGPRVVAFEGGSDIPPGEARKPRLGVNCTRPGEFVHLVLSRVIGCRPGLFFVALSAGCSFSPYFGVFLVWSKLLRPSRCSRLSRCGSSRLIRRPDALLGAHPDALCPFRCLPFGCSPLIRGWVVTSLLFWHMWGGVRGEGGGSGNDGTSGVTSTENFALYPRPSPGSSLTMPFYFCAKPNLHPAHPPAQRQKNPVPPFRRRRVISVLTSTKS